MRLTVLKLTEAAERQAAAQAALGDRERELEATATSLSRSQETFHDFSLSAWTQHVQNTAVSNAFMLLQGSNRHVVQAWSSAFC